MTTVIALFFVSLALALGAYPPLIHWLRAGRIGQLIREEGPAAHQAKAGTPTAGGILFPAIAVILYLAGDRSPGGALVVLGLLFGGALGFLDDLAKIRGRRNLGLRARQKILIQLLSGGVLGYLALRWGLTRQQVPLGGAPALGGWMIPIGLVAFAAGSNAFNLTDGSDGLSAGAGALVFGTLAGLALLQHHAASAIMPAVLAGALLGFLAYNRYPARIFMGDTGSLGLGMAMVAAAIATGLLWYLPLLAIVFVAETLSVMLQVLSFKTTGRRILKMSPLHHHFQLSGWSENRVAGTFWAVTLVAALLTVLAARQAASS
ncbi:MAG TPA: phospho-N-acetylmuramoyl-pentapeptide-transferase [Candidatus Limnocylindrales bacterium]|nr:phospho-N-acetylmuramoyl-pentapeptide-transferase [Candidatus Limnocylindrales bacterium]